MNSYLDVNSQCVLIFKTTSLRTDGIIFWYKKDHCTMPGTTRNLEYAVFAEIISSRNYFVLLKLQLTSRSIVSHILFSENITNQKYYSFSSTLIS